MTTDATRILERLLSFPTVSSDSNLPLIEWVHDYLATFGITSNLTYNAERTKANLFATVGRAVQGGVIASGHTDVVPVTGQAWSTDPFKAARRDDRIYGRGSCDMKGFIAVALGLVPRLQARSSMRPLYLALTFDEEIGCRGVSALLEALPESARGANICVVGEPTEMQVVVGHKGAGMYACEVSGLEMHASRAPEGVNAIEYAAEMIRRTRDLADRLAREERHQTEFDIPHTTVSVNRIQGGTAGNTVAAECRFLIDIRNLPCTRREPLIEELHGFARNELLPRMRSIYPAANIVIRQLADLPAFSTAAESPGARAALRAVGETRCCYAGFSSEAGFYQRLGIPTVICGPGSIAQAHKPDEFVRIEQLERCERMLLALLAD